MQAVDIRRPAVGIVGAGAMGTLFGYALAAVADVRVLDVRSDAIAAITRRGGLAIDGSPVRPVLATTQASALFGCSMLFLFVKAQHSLRALRPFAGQLNPATPVVSLQNGLRAEEAMKTALGTAVPVVLGVTTEAAMATGFGTATRVGRGLTVLGGASATPAIVSSIAELLHGAGFDARAVYDIRPHMWGKLVANAAINPVTGLLGAPNGVILSDPDAEALARELARETAAVAAALKISLPYPDAWEYVRDVARGTAENFSSMLQDLQAGRQTEIEAINGAVLAAARRSGVAAPFNESVTRLVRARERWQAGSPAVFGTEEEAAASG